MVIKINRQAFSEGTKTEVTAYEIGEQLSGNYIFVFEYSTILLLVALVGSMIIATQKNNGS
jgi:NADH:ubiquinone oxidoreductase subunit 6 (subunit J)